MHGKVGDCGPSKAAAGRPGEPAIGGLGKVVAGRPDEVAAGGPGGPTFA